MKRPGFLALASLMINLLLSASLIHIYLTTSDTVLKAWVDQYILSAFTVVLSVSLVTGSLFGYVLLRRRPSGLSLGRRLQRTGPLKQPSPLTRPTGLSVASKNVPIGPPPGPTSKHTAYAVPSLLKPSTQIPQRQTTPSSWSSAPKQWTPASFRAQRQEEESRTSQEPPPSPQQRDSPPFPSSFGRAPEEPPRNDPPRQISGFTGSRLQPSPPPPVPPPLEETARTGSGSYWKTHLGTEGASERTGSAFPTLPPENSQRPAPPYPRQPLGQSIDRPAGFTSAQQSSYGQSADSSSQPNRWTNPASGPGYSNPQKWLPPSVSPVPRQQVPMGSSFRPNLGPQRRPPMAGPQGPPRPLGYSGSVRPPSSSEGPRLRPDERRLVGTENQQASVSVQPETFSAQKLPELETRKGPPLVRPEPAHGQTASLSRENQQREASSASQSLREPLAGEMDWDTALDAILKTLRKDKVEDKP